MARLDMSAAFFTVALFVVALLLPVPPASAGAADDAMAECNKACAASYEKSDPGRLGACGKACFYEGDAAKGLEVTASCNTNCEGGDPAGVAKCKNPCKIVEAGTKAAAEVGSCYRRCVAGKEVADPAGCGEGCAGDARAIDARLTGMMTEFGKCVDGCTKAGGAEQKCVEECPVNAPTR